MPPSTFPRIDINTPSNLDEVTSSLLTAAESHLPLALERDGLSGKHEEAVCRRVLEQWKDGAASRIRENVTVNGVSWKTATKRGSRDEYDKIDTQLQTKVNNLSQTIDMLMEEAVTYRRELPLRKADALRARMEVLEDCRDRLAKTRQKELESKAAARGSASTLPALPFAGHEAHLQRALSTAIAQADSLAETMPRQIEMIRQQHELVLQLRSMPP